MINLIKDKAQQYGFNTLNNEELAKMAKLPANYENSAQYRAVKELIRREEIKELKQIKGSNDVYNFFKFLSDIDREEFHVIYTNRANKVMKSEFLSKGSTIGTVVCIKTIIKEACNIKASGVILCHNHPSGNNTPSSADTDTTRKIKEALNFIDCILMDHVIIAKDKYFSFADEGLI